MTDVEVGQIIEGPATRDLPLGTVLRNQRYNNILLGLTEAGWVGRQADEYPPTDLSRYVQGQFTVVAVPDKNIYREETLTRFKHRFKTTALSYTQLHGIGRAPVVRCLRALELDDDHFNLDLSVGMLVGTHDYDLRTRLPHGTVIEFGMTEHFDTHGVYCWDQAAQRFRPLIGGLSPRGVGRLVYLPGTDNEPLDWVSEEPGEGDAQALLEFKHRAWEMGNRAKQEASWCGAYENVMDRVGLTARWIIQHPVDGSAPPSEPFTTGDQVRRNDRRWSVGGRTVAAPTNATEGTVVNIRTDGSLVIRFNNRYEYNIDPVCVDYVTPSLSVGDRVTRRQGVEYLCRGEHRPEWERIATPGRPGSITRPVGDHAGGVVEVRWDDSGNANLIDPVCLRRFEEAVAQPEAVQYEIGQRIRRIPGVPHRARGNTYTREAADGAVGIVHNVYIYDHGIAAVQVEWVEGGLRPGADQRSRIDVDCIEPWPEQEHRFRVGQRIERGDWPDLPVGTTLRGFTSGRIYTVHSANRVTRQGGSREHSLAWHQDNGTMAEIVSLP